MQVVLLWFATVMSLVTFYIHTFIGGPRVAEPLLENSSLPKASKWLNYFTWHVTTIFTLLMGGGYAYVAMHPSRPELVVFLTLLTGCFSLLSAAIAIKGDIHPFRFPSTSLFAIVCFLGLASLFYQ